MSRLKEKAAPLQIALISCVLMLLSACDYVAPTDGSNEASVSGVPGPGTGSGYSSGTGPIVIATASPAMEGDVGTTAFVVDVTLSFVSGSPTTIEYATSDLSAVAGEDYVKAKGKLRFSRGETQKSVTISIVGDSDVEPDETFSLNLHVENGAVLESSSVTLTILNDDQPLSGLPSRPVNVSCLAPERPAVNTDIATELAFPSLMPAFVKPVGLLQAPGDSSQWYLVEQDGRVQRFANNVSVSSADPFIDISGPGGAIDVDSADSEAGLLGMAFSPNYGNGDFDVYLSYMVDEVVAGRPYRSIIARFESLDNGLTLDADQVEDAKVLITLDQPYTNHNGGHIAFGPDDNLYIHFGDGGSGNDPGDRAQNTTNLFGALLRIDPNGGSAYSIPGDNPFAGNDLCADGEELTSCPEIYAWGLRNAWRWNFDSATGDLWLGDVGQSRYEEVDIIELGGNYGWRCREGAHDHITSGNCPGGFTDPVIEYGRTVGQSITGGFVYRGSAIPELIGRYVFADYIQGRIFASVADGQGGYTYETLLDTPYFISSFAEDENGELLFLDYGNGQIRRIVQGSGSSTDTIPTLLSDTGCVDALDPTQPAAGLIPYDINVPFWSDGAVKERFYAIPDGTTIDVDADGDWLFPNGTVLMKNFRLNDELFETRLFMRHPDGVWAGYTYEWNQAGTDATRVIGGKTKDVQGQPWEYPSESGLHELSHCCRELQSRRRTSSAQPQLRIPIDADNSESTLDGGVYWHVDITVVRHAG